MSRKWIGLLLCAALVAGCSAKEPPGGAGTPKGPPLVIGLIPEQNIFKQLERYEPLGEYISRKCGVDVRFKILARYGNIIDNFRTARLDGAFFGSFTYALAHSRIGVRVIARPVGRDNTSTYHGLIFVRRNSGIRTARDMKGKRFAFVDKATTAGYLLPAVYFHHNGINDFRHFLKETYFAGTHEDAINDVLNGKADVGAAKNTIFARLSRENPGIKEELVILERSPDVPENGLAFREDIDPSLPGKVRELLLGMDRDEEGKAVLGRFGALRFVGTTDADYEPVFRFAREAHIDLSTYDYVND